MISGIQELQRRGFIAATTSNDLNDDKPLTAYIGFDLTAPSLHVGSLIQLMALKILAENGNTVIALLGEATTKVGDPSGRDQSRPMLAEDEINLNRVRIEAIIKKIVPEAIIVNNNEWFSEQSFLGFLRDFGQHFTINRMMTFDTVKRRIENQIPMTFLEFSYMLLQAVDFLKLFERVNCTLQIGGSDQWGNIVNGIELVRKVTGKTVFGLTTKLLTNKSGQKMGKTAGNAIWLDATMTTPFDFFQFWRNVEDEKVEEFENLFTDGSPVETVDINIRKERLAFEVTALVHGEDTAKNCLVTAHEAFKEGAGAFTVQAVETEMLSQFIHRIGFSASRSDALRLIKGNAVSLDDSKVTEDRLVSNGVLWVGKKKSVRIV